MSPQNTTKDDHLRGVRNLLLVIPVVAVLALVGYGSLYGFARAITGVSVVEFALLYIVIAVILSIVIVAVQGLVGIARNKRATPRTTHR